MKFKSVLIKISGEALAKKEGFGIDENIVNDICKNIKIVTELGVKVSIVVGGGNIWRGKNGKDMNKTTSDYMGMLATVINGLAIQSALENIGVETRLQTAIEMKEIAEPYIRRKAVNHLQKNRVVIFAAGTGNPFFTTDTCAALRAAEMEVDAILLAKSIDGVYDSDPRNNLNAKKFDEISFQEVLNNKLKALDLTATSLCMENNIPIYVFEIKNPENILKVLNGENVGTIIK